MPRNSLAKRAGGRRVAGASSRRFVRARAMVIASHHANVACGATRLPWLPVRSSSSPRARWNRLEQAEQATPPASRRGAERDRGIAFARAAAPCCHRAKKEDEEEDKKVVVPPVDRNLLPAADRAELHA